MVDQMRSPRFQLERGYGFHEPLKRVFGFRGGPDEENEFQRFFPGLWALRDNAVVLNEHRVASSACVPSRTALFSGQYGTITGAHYTDGCFKPGSDPNFPWLDPERFPTLGDWMRSAGYTTHYFGKWHISGGETRDLEAYGFGDWERSYPDPHGGLANNLGHYRDYQFAVLVRSFLISRGLGVPLAVKLANAAVNARGSTLETSKHEISTAASTMPPWFAVCSLTNPHDIALYAAGPRRVSSNSVGDASFTLAVPAPGQPAALPPAASMTIRLNKRGFPQDNASLPLTWAEDLVANNKPRCQLESAYKVGLSIMSHGGWWTAKQAQTGGVADHDALFKLATQATLNADFWGMPLPLTSAPNEASLRYLQYYGYLISEVDQHILSVLQTLEETGQADNTIVIFTADHGENGGAHGGMMQKFHTAYEETIRVPMVVRFPRRVLEVKGRMKQFAGVTSHIDLLPTVLGFAGVDRRMRDEIERELRASHPQTYTPVGTDLSDVIVAQARGEDVSIIDSLTNAERQGVLFITHDTISEPLRAVPRACREDRLNPFEIYDAAVAELIRRAKAGEPGAPSEAARLTGGPICEPGLVHCVVTKDGWKLARYFSSVSEPLENNHFELYDLRADPYERHNLLIYDGEFPTVIADIPNTQPLDVDQLTAKAHELMALLTALETRMLAERTEERWRRSNGEVQPVGRHRSATVTS